MRIAIVYDCLYPHTIGGGERWYRSLAECLAQRHEVAYVTRRSWPRGSQPDAPVGVKVIPVSGGQALYTASGRRGILGPLVFGLGLFGHLLRHRHEYDVVHVCAFPYFSLIAVRLAQMLGGPPFVTDWLEVWPTDYWKNYLGGFAGTIGGAIQRLCVHATGRAFVLSRLQARRLVESGYRGEPRILEGLYSGSLNAVATEVRRQPLIVFIGRHIREKRVTAIPAAFSLARESIPDLRAMIFGDGPDRDRLLAEIERLGLRSTVTSPGFAPWNDIDQALRHAMCLLLPSTREGYGLSVVEAMARSTPAILVRDSENAATELIEEGINGFIAENADPQALAAALIKVHRAGASLIASTARWYGANAARLSVEGSISTIERTYAELLQPS
jgi:glycosyltransferase involved in cell wall biosynthesis